ncbi:serine/threonine protein kinase [Pelomyxa schiedti]|nr:serine/threonine protein kinase [Pelomyxa schiedti]
MGRFATRAFFLLLSLALVSSQSAGRPWDLPTIRPPGSPVPLERTKLAYAEIARRTAASFESSSSSSSSFSSDSSFWWPNSTFGFINWFDYGNCTSPYAHVCIPTYPGGCEPSDGCLEWSGWYYSVTCEDNWGIPHNPPTGWVEDIYTDDPKCLLYPYLITLTADAVCFSSGVLYCSTEGEAVHSSSCWDRNCQDCTKDSWFSTVKCQLNHTYLCPLPESSSEEVPLSTGAIIAISVCCGGAVIAVVVGLALAVRYVTSQRVAGGTGFNTQYAELHNKGQNDTQIELRASLLSDDSLSERNLENQDIGSDGSKDKKFDPYEAYPESSFLLSFIQSKRTGVGTADFKSDVINRKWKKVFIILDEIGFRICTADMSKFLLGVMLSPSSKLKQVDETTIRVSVSPTKTLILSNLAHATGWAFDGGMIVEELAQAHEVLGRASELKVQNCEIMESQIELTEEIGRGGFGSVFRGKFLKHKEIAAKRLLPQAEMQARSQFLREMLISRKLHHPNIVDFLGICCLNDGVYMICEFITDGPLHHHIFKESYIPSFSVVFAISSGICSGMQHLHSMSIIHRDLKPENILVADAKNWHVKIADFGLSRPVSKDNQTVTSKQGTRAYSALEQDQAHHTFKVDCFSFGIILWELMTGKRLLGGRPAWDIDAIKATGNLGPIPDLFPPRVSQLILRCWAVDPAVRPTFQECLDILTAESQQKAASISPPTAPAVSSQVTSLPSSTSTTTTATTTSTVTTTPPNTTSETNLV